MTLHDRIRAINVQSDRKRADVRAEAAALAKEADELMEEMADVIKAFYVWTLHKGAEESAEMINEVLEKYKMYGDEQ